MSLSTTVKVILVIVLVGLSFWGGVIYGKGFRSGRALVNYLAERSEYRRYAIGLVVYISPSSITIANENNSGAQEFNIKPNTLISINGVRAKATQIQPGNIALIRVDKLNSNQAADILVNSHFKG
jgi:hypothetical protein